MFCHPEKGRNETTYKHRMLTWTFTRPDQKQKLQEEKHTLKHQEFSKENSGAHVAPNYPAHAPCQTHTHTLVMTSRNLEIED